MIFSEDVEKICAYCENAVLMQNKSLVICKKNGVIAADSKCRYFLYDPLKRIPLPKKIKGNDYTEEDFSIE